MIKHFLLLLLVLAQTLYAAAGLEAAEIPPKPQAGKYRLNRRQALISMCRIMLTLFHRLPKK